MALTTMHSDMRSNPSSGLCINLFIGPKMPMLLDVEALCTESRPICKTAVTDSSVDYKE